MAGREPRTIRVDPELYKRFEQYVEDNVGNKGEHMENALSEYMDENTNSVLEDKIDHLTDLVEGTVSENELERERDSASSSNQPNTRTLNTLEDVVSEFPPNGSITLDDVEDAITEQAGGSYKTLEKYKKLLLRRGHLYEHPTDEDVYILDSGALAMNCETTDEVTPAQVREIVEEYKDEFGSELEYPEEWYLNAITDSYIEYNSLKYDEAPGLSSVEYREENGLTLDQEEKGEHSTDGYVESNPQTVAQAATDGGDDVEDDDDC